ncbi:MAG: hypothetical protein FWH40_03110 [Coriobacteriia bacterium]|nr:hypothetical protein [Coriobacteriia bacterium]
MKAVIIRHEKDGSYVLDSNGSFRFVKGYRWQPVGDEIELVAKPVYKQLQPLAIAASLLLVFAMSSYAWLWNTAKFSIVLDINPSIELVFNQFDQLIDTQALNDDGERLLKGVQLKGKPDEVVLSVVDAAEAAGYGEEDAGLPYVLVTIVTDKTSIANNQVRILDDAFENNYYSNIAIIQACTKDYCQDAKNQGVSPGRLLLAERVLETDPSKTLSELLLMSTSELINEADNAGIATVDPGLNNTAASDTDNPNKGPGNNSGNAEDNPNKGPGNNSGNTEDNPNKGPGNNSGNAEDNPNKGPGSSSGNTGDNPNKGAGNNSGNTEDDPGEEPGNTEDDPSEEPDNNSGSSNDNKNKGPGNNSGNNEDNPNKGSGNNSGNSGNNSNKGPGHNSGIK